MSIPYLAQGRTKQKERTYTAMVDAARSLLAEGATPTVEDAAARAGVSRATAYRYFTNQDQLLVATYPMLDMPSLLQADPPEDPVERVALVARRIVELILESEMELRTSLRMSLESGAQHETPLRKGRRLLWFEDALGPLRGRVPPAVQRRLTLALASSVGVETFVWLTDLGGLDRSKVADQFEWTARTLTQAVLTGNGASSPSSRRRSSRPA